MVLVAKHSRPGEETWCRSVDGATASWFAYYPPAAEESSAGSKEPKPALKQMTCNFRQGKAEGMFTAWHRSGKVWLEGQYEGGVKAGTWLQRGEGGLVVARAEYREGALVAGAPVGIPALCETIMRP
jgi:hypothetical protein